MSITRMERREPRHPLFRHCHQVLGAEVVTQGVEQVIVRGIGVHARASERVDRCCHGEGRHGTSAPGSGELWCDTISTKHVHVRHYRIPWGVWHHSIDASGVLVRKLWHANRKPTVFRAGGRSWATSKRHEWKLREAGTTSVLRHLALGCSNREL